MDSVKIEFPFEEEPIEVLDVAPRVDIKLRKQEIRNRKQHNLKEAMKSLRQGGITIHAAAKRFSINYETLRQKYYNNIDDMYIAGQKLAFPSELEQQLVDWFRQSEDFGCQLNRNSLKESALFLSKDFNKKFLASYGWTKNLMQRYNLQLNQPISSITWQSTIQQSLEAAELDFIMESPLRVWRCDYVLLKRDKSALFPFSANGAALKPHLIKTTLPKKRYKDIGNITYEEFARYLEEDFEPQLRQLGVPFPIILFLGKEASHDHIQVWQTARNLGINIVTLHPDIVKADKRFLKALESTSIDLRTGHITESIIKQSFKAQRLFPWSRSANPRPIKREISVETDPLVEENIFEVILDQRLTYKCRACRREGDEDFVSMGEERLAIIFKDLTGIVVDEESPSFVCMKCKIQLESFADFRRLCLSSQVAFEAEKEGKDQVQFNEPSLEFIMEPSLQVKVDEKIDHKIIVSALNQPIIRNRSNEERIKCNDCRKKFKRRFFLKHWLYNHRIDEEPSICSECGKSLQSVYMLEKHLREEHGVLKCVNCDRVDHIDSGRTALRNHKQHIQSCTNYKDHYDLKCKLCGSKYITADGLELHRSSCKGVKTVICELCGISVKANKYSNHKSTHSTKIYNCRYCSRTFKNNSLRTYHESANHNPSNKPFHCAHCSMKFRMKHSLERHIRRQHFGPPKPKKKCKICGAEVLNLRLHMPQHTDYRPYACEVTGCGAMFRSQTSLIKHRFSHSKTRPYNCTLCTTGYYQTAYLRDHYQRTHGILYVKGEIVPYLKGTVNMVNIQEEEFNPAEADMFY